MKERILQLIYCPSMLTLVFAAVLLGLAPFVPEPHLWQKARMLWYHDEFLFIDAFDVFWHGWPLLWIALRLLTHAPHAHCRL